MSCLTTNNGNKNSQKYLYDLLARIKQRPGMYLGKVSLTRLKMLLMGYSMSRGELGLQLTQEEKQFAQFQQWIQRKYQINSSEGWESIILSQVEDEKLAFDLFFQLFEQFNLECLQLDKITVNGGK
ncbi:MAG: hypothetical protein J7525_20745 [Roseofilum sp. SID3]|uniref:hypothetical protein n=1 Tax=Roseofilum sp. SID3 TaxID=2821499 RepID=UPI001B0FBC5F|nr:hypothetical protein [Roseofilum sp. SID3]MBP0015522.1 hypothetical protein [Roseofilum sp. SID3]